MLRKALFLLAALVGACSSDMSASDGTFPYTIPPDPQRAGDPQKGYSALVNEGYVSCGIPLATYQQYAGPTPSSLLIPGRDGDNATLPYNLTSFTTKSGVKVVTANCLSCHAGFINDQLVVGLGDAAGDFTTDLSPYAAGLGTSITDPAAHDEWAKWNDRVQAIGPYTVTLTVGVNPADNLAAVLFAHRDPTTLAWSDVPLLDLPPDTVVPVDVPPWWRMKKKNAMFYDAAGRGDHARIMMTASTLCSDSVAEAQAIDAYFPDVEAYILSLEAPRWPFPVDSALASSGQTIYERHCAECHGSSQTPYPNLVIGLDDVASDDSLARGASQFASRFVDWFNRSYYGQVSHLAPMQGYVAPPLDGVWATAPYLHNGSVPTLAALLDSSKRPRFWTRTFSSTDYDQAAVGWRYTALSHGQLAGSPHNVRSRIYDTTQPGYGNGGHTYGDTLSDDQRAALLEYLKTL